MNFYPEGTLIDMPQNKQRTSSLFSLGEAAQSGEVLEGRAVVCDTGHNLTVALGGGLQGIIPRVEGAIGIEEGLTRDIAIISRVNKPVSFVVTGFEAVGGQISPMLSRRAAQQKCLAQYVSELAPGQIIGARVTHLETFGCFVDIGCGLPSMIPIDAISVSRISHPRERFRIGQDIRAVVKSVEGDRVCLTHKELLGTWEENAALFSSGQTVAGVIRSVEPYGIFVELTPNLAGLAEPRDGVQCGQHASVYIKSLIAQKMKIKLTIVDSFDADYPIAPFKYFITEGRLAEWTYSPENSMRTIKTVFE
jgi:small subunit ribosomal protein S1